jgi:hypothetical protein
MIKRCMHCDRDIRWHPSGLWYDSDGIWYCMRVAGGDPLRHTPMPLIK